MRTLGNVLWLIPFLGFITASLCWLFGAALTLTVVAAPIGLGLMEYGKFLFAPFGRAMVSKDSLNIRQNNVWMAYSAVIQILYFPFGLIFVIIAAIRAVALCVTLVGIPAALVVAKSLGTVFSPVNKKCVPVAVVEELDRRRAQAIVEKHLRT
jgi:uncharacterized membrane protein YccF (DUF307 family)